MAQPQVTHADGCPCGVEVQESSATGCMAQPQVTHAGGCHCGAVRFEVRTPVAGWRCACRGILAQFTGGLSCLQFDASPNLVAWDCNCESKEVGTAPRGPCARAVLGREVAGRHVHSPHAQRTLCAPMHHMHCRLPVR